MLILLVSEGQNDANGSRPLEPKVSSRLIDLEAMLARKFDNPIPGDVGNRLIARQRPRDGRDRDTGEFRQSCQSGYAWSGSHWSALPPPCQIANPRMFIDVVQAPIDAPVRQKARPAGRVEMIVAAWTRFEVNSPSNVCLRTLDEIGLITATGSGCRQAALCPDNCRSLNICPLVIGHGPIELRCKSVITAV